MEGTQHHPSESVHRHHRLCQMSNAEDWLNEHTPID